MGMLLLAAVLSATPAQADPFEWKGDGPDLKRATSLRELTLWRNDIYARAHNPFRKRWLDEWFRQFAWYQPHAQMEVSQLSETQILHAQKVAERESSLTRADLLAGMAGLTHEVRTPEEELELRLRAVRLGGWPAYLAKPRDLTPLEDPDQLDRLLDLEQLADFSPRDLKLLRETVKARRGFSFDSDADLAGHFKTVDWYKPAKNPRLSKLDRANIKLISSVLKTIHQPEPSELLPAVADPLDPLLPPRRAFYGWG
jgi:hypothetical protein